jgi:hypothetical protein
VKTIAQGLCGLLTVCGVGCAIGQANPDPSAAADAAGLPDAHRWWFLSDAASAVDSAPALDAIGNETLPPPDAATGTDASAPAAHLLISEVIVMPTGAESIEVYNPTSDAIDLSNYYLSDRNDYFLVVTGSVSPVVNDFIAQFPVGATIASGEYQTVALHAASDFMSSVGAAPTYQVAAGSGAPTMVPAMPGAIGSMAGLTDGGEPIVLFYWDGISGLVQDVDYVVYGTGTGGDGPIDKTGVIMFGLTGTVQYQPDTPWFVQTPLAPHRPGGSLVRCMGDQLERWPGGNGITGADETSEPWQTTWRVNMQTVADRTSNAPPSPGFCQ